jgi:hypothetical protein
MIACARAGNGTRTSPMTSWHCSPPVRSAPPRPIRGAPPLPVNPTAWHPTFISRTAANDISPKNPRDKIAIQARRYLLGAKSTVTTAMTYPNNLQSRDDIGARLATSNKLGFTVVFTVRGRLRGSRSSGVGGVAKCSLQLVMVTSGQKCLLGGGRHRWNRDALDCGVCGPCLRRMQRHSAGRDRHFARRDIEGKRHVRSVRWRQL